MPNYRIIFLSNNTRRYKMIITIRRIITHTNTVAIIEIYIYSRIHIGHVNTLTRIPTH